MKKTDQISVRLEPETYATLQEIHRRHAISPVELARSLVCEAAGFYRQHGWFGFPVELHPVSVPHRIEAVAEPAARYPRKPG